MFFCTRFAVAMIMVVVTAFPASAQSSGTDADRGHTGDGGPAEKAQTSNPDIITLGPNGNLFIPDHINAVVRKLTRVVK